MNPNLPDEATDFGATADKAFTALGGVDAARRAEAEPDYRSKGVAGALAALGVDGLDPRQDLHTAAAAGELCRAAGRVALPYPVVGTLLRDAAGRPLALVAGASSRADHSDLFGTWRVAHLDGTARQAAPGGARLATKLAPFVGDLRPADPLEPAGAVDVAMHLTLTAHVVLGYAERALELAVEHVKGRVQFGQPLAAFQAVQFQLADAAVAVEGLRQLCRYTLWRLAVAPEAALADALAARVHGLQAAHQVMRTSQQLHGAAGLCDEYDVSVLCRHVQPSLRLPFGVERSTLELAGAVARSGFEGLFPHGPAEVGAR